MTTHMTIGVILSTSTTELRFLRTQLDECAKFASQTIVCIGNHRFDGITPEPLESFESVIREYPNVHFLIYPVTPPETFSNPLPLRPGAYWHNMSRIVGALRLKEDIHWVMFLDGDEVPEGAALNAWEQHALAKGTKDRIIYLANYWYFKDPIYRAKYLEQSVPVVPRSLFSDEKETVLLLMDANERYCFTSLDLEVCEFELSLNKEPMIHHFSWVRSKEDILRKIATWGHQGEQPWEALIEETWDKAFDGRDFVHGYEYDIVENKYGL